MINLLKSDICIVEKHIEMKYPDVPKEDECSYIQKDIFFPAKESEIIECEEALKCKLPKSYRNFLLIHNGALISTLEPEIWGEVDLTDWMYAPASRIIMSTEYLSEFTAIQMERYAAHYDESLDEYRKRWGNLICFCYCGAEGDGSFLALDPLQGTSNEYPVLYCLSTENIEDWRQDIYYKSFKEFLIDCLQPDQKYDFLDAYLNSLEEDT